MALLEWGVKKLINITLGGISCSQDLLVLRNLECVRIGTVIGTEKSHGKEVRTEIGIGNGHVNTLVIGEGIVIIGMIGITETGIGIGTGIGTGTERETVDVIEIEDVTVIEIEDVTVIATGIVNMIVIVTGIGIMKLGKPIGDAHMTGKLIMIIMNSNMIKTVMVREIATMNRRMIVGGTINLHMDIGMQILTIILIPMTTMNVIEDEGNMIMVMTKVTITISILIMIGWKMTVPLRGQHLNPVKGREIEIWTVNTDAQRGPILGSTITRNLSVTHLNFTGNIHCFQFSVPLS